jgi:hypothetical protein
MKNKCTARHASHDDKSHCVFPCGHDKAHRDSSGRLFAYHSAPDRYRTEKRADKIATLESENAALRKEVEGLRCCSNCGLFSSKLLKSKYVKNYACAEDFDGYSLETLRIVEPNHVCDSWQPARGKG